MGSRARTAAAGLLIVTCALLMGGVGDAVASAAPVHDSAGADDSDASRTGSSRGDGPGTRSRAGRGGERRNDAGSGHGQSTNSTPGDPGPGVRRPGDRKPGDRKPGHERRDTKPAAEKPEDHDDGRAPPTRPDTPAGAGSPNQEEPEEDCGLGWSWSPSGPEPDTVPTRGNGGGGVGAPTQPFRRPQVPAMQRPADPRPESPPQAPVAPPAPPPAAVPPSVVPGGAVPGLLPPASHAPRGATVDAPAGHQAPTRTGRSAGLPLTLHRPGYPEYLRGAGAAQVSAVAAPGLVGILLITGLGVLVGYRQAKAGRAIRLRGAAKFVN